MKGGLKKNITSVTLLCTITTPASYLIQYCHGKIAVPAQQNDATNFLLI